jgi:hypothetical protein
MNRRIIALVLFLGLESQTEVMSQSAFQNLDFESAILSTSDRGSWVNPAIALPYWNISSAGWPPLQGVMYNGISVGASVMAVEDREFGTFQGEFRAISGNYSALFQAGRNEYTIQRADITISQSGTVQALSQSLLFRTRGAIPEGWFAVYFQNQLLPIQQVRSLDNNINVYGCDISAFQSRYGELRLTGVAPSPFGLWTVLVDDLEFSPTPVPEPASVILLALGGVSFFAFHRRIDAAAIWTGRHATR